MVLPCNIVLTSDGAKLPNDLLLEFVSGHRWPHEVPLVSSRSRNNGAIAASGEVVIFLDAHCEVGYNWLPPLLAPIHADRSVGRNTSLPRSHLVDNCSLNWGYLMVLEIKLCPGRGNFIPLLPMFSTNLSLSIAKVVVPTLTKLAKMHTLTIKHSLTCEGLCYS